MFSRYTALIVEDEARSLETISNVLRSLGVRFKRNTTGASVTQQVVKLNPDFVLLNTDLPDGDCLDICTSLSHDSRTRNIPIVAIADDFPMSMIEKLCLSGFSACIEKPLIAADLHDIFRLFLADHSFPNERVS